MAYLCSAINLIAFCAYLLLMAWAFFTEPGAGVVLAVFALWDLLPYKLSAAAAMSYAKFPGTLVVIFFFSLVSAPLVLLWEHQLVLMVQKEHAAIAAGARNCGPPSMLIAGFWLLVLPVVQLVGLAACLIVSRVGRTVLTANWN